MRLGRYPSRRIRDMDTRLRAASIRYLVFARVPRLRALIGAGSFVRAFTARRLVFADFCRERRVKNLKDSSSLILHEFSKSVEPIAPHFEEVSRFIHDDFTYAPQSNAITIAPVLSRL